MLQKYDFHSFGSQKPNGEFGSVRFGLESPEISNVHSEKIFSRFTRPYKFGSVSYRKSLIMSSEFGIHELLDLWAQFGLPSYFILNFSLF